jgi:hypothetical protein
LATLFEFDVMIACASDVANEPSVVSLKFARITRTVFVDFAGTSDRLPPLDGEEAGARTVMRIGRRELSLALTVPPIDNRMPGSIVVGIAAMSMRRTLPPLP